MPKNTTPVPANEVLPGMENLDRSREEQDQAFLDALAAESLDNGTGDTSQNPDAQSSDTEDEELENSGVNIRKPTMQQLLDRLDRLERQNEQLREQARPGGQNYEEPEEEWEPEEWEIPDKPGYEEFMPEYRARMNHLYGRLQRIERENERLRQLMVIDRSQDHLSRFKRDHGDWKQFEQAMLDHAEKLGGFPSDYDGLVELYDTVKDRMEVQRLRQDRQAARRAGPSPRVGTTRTASREKLQSAPSNGKPMSIQEALRQAARRMQQSPGMF